MRNNKNKEKKMQKNIVKALKNAKITSGGNYLGEGKHILEVRKAQFKETRKNEAMFAAEFRVLRTSSSEKGKQIGDTVDVVFVDRNDSYAGNVKALLAALAGLTEAEFDSLEDDELGEIIDGLTGDETQGAVGVIIECEGTNVVSKKINPTTGQQTEYTRFRWTSLDQDQAQAEYKQQPASA